jgi:hypothetical protein
MIINHPHHSPLRKQPRQETTTKDKLQAKIAKAMERRRKRKDAKLEY